MYEQLNWSSKWSLILGEESWHYSVGEKASHSNLLCLLGCAPGNPDIANGSAMQSPEERKAVLHNVLKEYMDQLIVSTVIEWKYSFLVQLDLICLEGDSNHQQVS